VACNAGGICEVIEDGVTGLLVPPGDTDALYSALERLLSDKALREEMGRRGRKWVEREADSRECLCKLEAFYIDVVQKCGRSLEHVK
jgi:glycosyltransferase involved in cell wall biosynthesis